MLACASNAMPTNGREGRGHRLLAAQLAALRAPTQAALVHRAGDADEDTATAATVNAQAEHIYQSASAGTIDGVQNASAAIAKTAT